MGVRILNGKADATTTAAALYDSATGRMLGRLWEAEDAEEQAEAFLGWLSQHRWYADRVLIFGSETDAMRLRARNVANGRDARDWTPGGLDKLVAYWRSIYVGEDGWLLDPMACECGHHHVEGDEDGTDAGCASCGCGEWRPGNPVAALRMAEGGKVLV